MSETKNDPHTQEPWFYGSYGSLLIVGNHEGRPDKHNVIANLGPQHFPSNTEEYSNAERIVLCVNACVGMTEDQLDGHTLLDEITTLRQQLTETQRLLDEANGKVEELEKDAERIEWLDANFNFIEGIPWGSSLRNEIDKSMKARTK